MPVFASNVLHGGPYTLGFLMAATGLGALTGAANLALRKTVLGLGRRIALADAVFGASLVLFALSRAPWLSMLILTVTGFGMMQQMAASNTILQTIVADEKRGRVMAFYAMAFMGMTPFGSLLAGSLASHIGAPRTVMLSGGLCLAGSLWFARLLRQIRELVRPVYAQQGILPELATGVQQASSMQTPPES